VDAREEGRGTGRRQVAAVRVLDLEEHPVAAAVVARRVHRPVVLVGQPFHVHAERRIECVAGWTFAAEDGAHGACLVPTRSGV
jgi:hypothetical protein